jgi:hypothetical protein
MGQKMDKTTVIYGQSKDLAPKDVKWAEVEKAIKAKIGDEEIEGLQNAKTAVAQAMANKKLQSPYVKVGEIGDNLVLRIKDKGLLKDTEKDTILVKDYKAKKQAFANKPAQSKPAVIQPKTDITPEAILQEAEEHLELRRKVIPIMQGLLKEFQGAQEEATGFIERAEQQLAEAKENKAKTKATEAAQAADSVVRSADQVRDIAKRVQARNNEVMTKSGGDVLRGRSDFEHKEKLPPERKETFKAESNRLFGEGDKVAQKIKLVLKQVVTLAAEVDVLTEAAELYSIQPSSSRPPGYFIPRLTSIKEEATAAAKAIDLKAQKFARLPETLKVKQENPNLSREDKLKNLDQNKQLVDAVELEVEELAGRVKTFKERIKLIPAEAKKDQTVNTLMVASIQECISFGKHHLDYQGHIRRYREYDQKARDTLG